MSTALGCSMARADDDAHCPTCAPPRSGSRSPWQCYSATVATRLEVLAIGIDSWLVATSTPALAARSLMA